MSGVLVFLLLLLLFAMRMKSISGQRIALAEPRPVAPGAPPPPPDWAEWIEARAKPRPDRDREGAAEDAVPVVPVPEAHGLHAPSLPQPLRTLDGARPDADVVWRARAFTLRRSIVMMEVLGPPRALSERMP